MPIPVAVRANNSSRGVNNYHRAMAITMTTPKRWPITVAFASFYFKNSFKINCTDINIKITFSQSLTWLLHNLHGSF